MRVALKLIQQSAILDTRATRKPNDKGKQKADPPGKPTPDPKKDRKPRAVVKKEFEEPPTVEELAKCVNNIDDSEDEGQSGGEVSVSRISLNAS